MNALNLYNGSGLRAQGEAAHSENLNDLKLLSVIIPAYNTAKFLNKCVASIAEQTYQNIEIVIVNNGSTDSTPEICEELKAKYNNRIFKIINLNPNQGINFARRAGFEAASGDYVTTIDSDDYIDLSAYEKAIKVLEENNLDMVQFGYYDVYTDGRIIEAHKLQPVKFNNARDSFKNFASIIIDHLTLLWDKVYKRELFENLEWPKVSYTEDYCTDVQLFAKAEKFMSIEDIFYYHMRNPDSVCNSKVLNKQRITDLLSGINFVNEFTAQATPEFLPEILYYSINLHFDIIILNILSGKPEIQELINQCIKMLEQDYKRMKQELKAQGRDLYCNKKLIRKTKIHLSLLIHCPSLYKFYLKTRLKIKALTGI